MSLTGLSPTSREGYGSRLFGAGEDPALGIKARLASPSTDAGAMTSKKPRMCQGRMKIQHKLGGWRGRGGGGTCRERRGP